MPSSPIALDATELDDLDLLLSGALSPTSGFTLPGAGPTLARPDIDPHTRGSVILTDLEGAPIAELTVTDAYQADVGTGLIGTVRKVGDRAPRPFERLYRQPSELAPDADDLAVPTDQPLTAADLDTIAARAGRRGVRILALVGAGRPRGTSADGLIRACLATGTLLANTEVVAVPLAQHADQAADEEMYRQVVAAYTPSGADPVTDVVRLPHAGPLPESVVTAATLDRPRGTRQGLVLFFTGLSGSGKSTIAQAVRNALIETGDRTAVTLLDGDIVRRHLSAGLGFSRADRDTNIRRIGWVAAEISRHGGTAIASPIAPFAATRDAVRAMVTDAGGAFVLVHVATPLEECERRDRKGLYARARAGEIPDFTGISSPYEEPDNADLRIDTTDRTIADAADDVLRELRHRGLISG